MHERLFDFVYAYICPGSILDGEQITRRAATEVEAFASAKEHVEKVSKEIGLRLVEQRETSMRRSA